MANKIPYKQCPGSNEAYEQVKQNFTAEELEKMHIKADLSFNDESKSVVAKGKGFQATFDFGENSLVYNLELSFFLKGFKGKIISMLEKKLGRLI